MFELFKIFEHPGAGVKPGVGVYTQQYYINYTNTGLFNIAYNVDSDSTIKNYGTGPRGDIYASNHVFLDDGQSITYPDGDYKYIYSVSSKQFELVNTNVIDFSSSHYFTCDIELTDNELHELNSKPDTIWKVWFNDFVLQDGFSKSNIVNYFPGCEAELSAEKIYDISDETYNTYVSITNYDISTKTTLKNVNYGPSTLQLTIDVSGIPTGYDNTSLNFKEDSYVNTSTNLNEIGSFEITEIIDGVEYIHKYNRTVLETYINNIEQTPILHTPEDAVYLLGKGVYPKLTSDLFTEYVQTDFKLELTPDAAPGINCDWELDCSVEIPCN